MARLLHKIKNPQDDLRLLNDNFDRIALDIADRSGTFSNVASVPGGITVASGEGHSVEIQVLDVNNIYSFGKLPVISRFDIYINNDLDGNYYWPAGSSITAAQMAEIHISAFSGRSVFNATTDEKATNWLVISNLSASPVTFYLYTDSFYIPSPETGIANRET